MSWEDVKKFATETGEKIIGRGARVKFRHDAEDWIKGGYTKEQAEHQTFRNRLDNMNREFKGKGFIDKESKQWDNMEAAVEEVVTDKNLFSNLILYANDARYFRNLPPNMPTAAAQNKLERDTQTKLEQYYKSKYEGQVPNPIIIQECTKINLQMQVLYARMRRELATATAANPAMSINDILAGNNQMAADVGRLMMLRNQLTMHENEFATDVDIEKSIEQSNIDAKKAMTEFFWKEPANFLPKMIPLLGNHQPIQNSLNFLTKQTANGLKLVYYGLKVGSAYARKTIRK